MLHGLAQAVLAWHHCLVRHMLRGHSRRQAQRPAAICPSVHAWCCCWMLINLMTSPWSSSAGSNGPGGKLSFAHSNYVEIELSTRDEHMLADFLRHYLRLDFDFRIPSGYYISILFFQSWKIIHMNQRQILREKIYKG
jgi:hypothetical protein